ncbi:hypothetical protein GCL60_16985 (plasmid) [Silvanigrella paludirubra]|uniref:Uncharacterized protein n=1 Tax=Silvanigrella paludirubra TaxID=2499159 RepID=A0A6N6VP46_9BACT|nr:hypothetical protein [Silvanigrella paludirubra]KAB8035643.1 hypothetical protein GCL60_16985 [Silvanigrella paludirubra]
MFCSTENDISSLNSSKLKESGWGYCAACNKEIESYSKIFDFSYCAGDKYTHEVSHIEDICFLCIDCGSNLEKISLSILEKEINFNKQSLTNKGKYKAICNLCGNKHDNEHYVLMLNEFQLTDSGMNESSYDYKCIYICNSCNYHLKNRFYNNKEFKILYNCNGRKFSTETPW